MVNYPFIVYGPRSRLVWVIAPKFSNALSRVLSLYPNKFIQTKHARVMDLITAQEEAKKLSLKSAHKQHVVLLPDGDFEVENAFSVDNKTDIYCTFHKGKKVDGPAVKKVEPISEDAPPKKKLVAESKPTEKEIKNQIKTENKMAKNAKKVAPAKKAAPAKKSAKKIERVAGKHARFQPVQGGAAAEILKALQSKKLQTKEALAKAGDTKVDNVSWYLGKLRNNGHVIELTDKGYVLKK